jgi:hypothetical protein
MARMFISEYEKMTEVTGGFRQAVGEEPSIAEQVVTFTATAGVSAAFNVKTKFVRIELDGIGNVLFGIAPGGIVAGTCKRLTAGQTEYFGVNIKDFAPGTMKAAAITDT